MNISSVMKYLFLLFLFPLSANASDCVILLHGLARTDGSMSRLEKVLEKNNYKVANISYPSRNYEIDQLAEKTIPKALSLCKDSPSVNFVTHSMGGILVRQYLKNEKIENLKHVVMLGPPNQGSEIVDKMSKIPGFKSINGPAGLQLGTTEVSVPSTLGPANFSLGIVAGTKSINLFLSAMLPKPNDGKVSVKSTKLEGMKDHVSMPVTHPFMMRNKKVINQVLYFLENGKFKKDKP